jgi:methyl-accepting chemotaxis protein
LIVLKVEREINMKMSISKKIISLAVAPLTLLILISSFGSAILLGSAIIDEVEKQLKLATYAISKETENMSITNTKEEVVVDLLEDFKEKNNIDITIFAGDIRMFSTVSDAIGTPMDATILQSIRFCEHYFSKNANVNGIKYYGYYTPIMQDGKYVGAFFAGEPAERVDTMIIQNMLNMSLMTVFIGVAAIILAVKVAKKIAKKIDGLKLVLETLNENDLSKEHEKYEVEHDELEEIKNKTIDFSKHLKVIVSTLKNMSIELKNIASDLNANAQFTNSTCSQISQAMGSVASGAVSQAEDTTSAAQNINEMSLKLEQIKGNTSDLRNIADSMSDAKNNALDTLSELQKVNGIMVNEIDSTNAQVNATSESVGQIEKAVGMIQDIADQTKLLSLNASIEAARAGEHGKGFAVVAEEIGKLANQSAQSSNEIEEILGHLVKNYDIIIENVKRTSDNMVVQNEKLVDTQNVFTTLEKDINGTVEKIVEINYMIENLNTEIGMMVDTISNLSAISEENSASTEETMAAIEELTAAIHQVSLKAENIDVSADKLMNDINIFKTE